jgi:hypothetical protein
MSVYISRQRDYSNDCLFVELAVGGPKNAGKDILTARYPGENKHLVDPRSCIDIAVEIHRRWNLDYGDEQKKLRIVGITTPLVYDFTTKGIAAAKTWADKAFANMDKCSACGRPLGNHAIFEHANLANQLFCAEVCVAKKHRDIYGTEPDKIGTGKKKVAKKKV